MADKKEKKHELKKVVLSKYIDVNPTLETNHKKKGVLTMGDFSPPSVKDQRLVENVQRYADLNNAIPIIFVNKQSVQEGYLDEHQRVDLSRAAFGDIVALDTVNGIAEALKMCEDKFSSMIIICSNETFTETKATVESIKENTVFESIDVLSYSDPEKYDIIAESIVSGSYMDFKQSIATPLKHMAKDLFESLNNQISEELLQEKIRPMSYSERIKKAQTMRRYANRLEVAKERAANRRASPEKLRSRARRKALEIIRARILRNKNYADLSNVEKNALDTRLMNIPTTVIERIAKRMLPVVRRAEADRYNSKHRGHYVSTSASSTGHHGYVNEAFENLMKEEFINEAYELLEATENMHYNKVKSNISAEKKADAIKHHDMIVSAKRADFNRKANSERRKIVSDIRETNEVIQSIIRKELERKKMISALHDYEKSPKNLDSDSPELNTIAANIVASHDLDPSKAEDLDKLYKRYITSKGHQAYLNPFDVNEADEENTPSDREWGTDSLTDIYKQSTPGQ